jgi:alkanesulfonate monooxygenase SsuD/methylene tetrahydromethanopterin reductase-like flavin-dependent oxidoreductase (luciferase family)
VTDVRVGIFPTAGAGVGEVARRAAALSRAVDEGIDHAACGDHVSFFVGAGSDGLVNATALLSMQTELPVYVGVYLLPLRHPVPVARQLATIAEMAPGRLTLGVGIGGEDPHEVEICGVDQRTRGRRMNECLEVLRGLATGEPLTFPGEFFPLEDALIVPAQSPPIPLVVGGRSEAALVRAGRLGDGWIGVWVSPQRYAAAVAQVAEVAEAANRDPSRFSHAMNVWCGFGPGREAARAVLAAGMEGFYRIPFESFERYSPYGTPGDVAEFLAPYVEAGCTTFNVIPCVTDGMSPEAAVGEMRRLLRTFV